MSASSDALLTKTDAELQFFVDNPQFYQSALVAAARSELARRAAENPRPVPTAAASELAPPLGSTQPPAAASAPAAPVWATPAPFAPPPPLDFAAQELGEPTQRRPWLVPALGVLTVATALGAYRWSAANQQAAKLEATRAAARLSPDSLKLDAVTTTAIPEYPIESLVDKQVATVPASARPEAQPLRQFREMSRRFWTAETQSEYLTQLADQGKTGSAFANQALLVRENWRAWNRGAMYGFKFGPKLQAQYELMNKVASNQQHILTRIPDLLTQQAFQTDKELVSRRADVQAMMASLASVSPVTGQPYKISTIQAR